MKVMAEKDIFKRIKNYLDSNSVFYREIHHIPTRTSVESAKARGEDMSIGGKAILLKVGDSFKLFVLSASRKLDSSKIRAYFRVKRIRFATSEELLSLTGLIPGSVPPFGRPILDFELYADPTITENDRIAFNAGSLTDSIVMNVKDYMKLASPIVFSLSC